MYYTAFLGLIYYLHLAFTSYQIATRGAGRLTPKPRQSDYYWSVYPTLKIWLYIYLGCPYKMIFKAIYIFSKNLTMYFLEFQDQFNKNKKKIFVFVSKDFVCNNNNNTVCCGTGLVWCGQSAAYTTHTFPSILA